MLKSFEITGNVMIINQALYRHTAIPAVVKGLDTGALRDKVIANNLANLTTPDYNRIEVKFEDELKRALDVNLIKGAKTKPNHMTLGRPDIAEVHPEAYRNFDPVKPGEVNNVDIDIEAAKLAENAINFQYAATLFQNQRDGLLSAIKGRTA